MSITYRQVLNRVLRTVSEATVSDSDTELTDSYHQLVGEFVNQIKEEIEAAFNWRVLRQRVPVTVLAGTSSIAVPAANNARLVRLQDYQTGTTRAMVFDVTDPSQAIPLTEYDLDVLTYELVLNTESGNDIAGFSLDIDPATGNNLLRVSPTVSVDKDIDIYMTVPQDYLEDDDLDTVILIPSRPLIVGSIYYALAERGEELGTNNLYTEERYRLAIDDAVSRENAERGELILLPT